jgi:hypothetical protein
LDTGAGNVSFTKELDLGAELRSWIQELNQELDIGAELRSWIQELETQAL